MATQYEQQAEILKRRAAIAAALRASGNEALPASLEVGRIHAPVSGWAHVAQAAKQALGGYLEGKAEKDLVNLSESQRKAQAGWMRGLSEAEAMKSLQPVQATGELLPSASPEQEARQSQGDALYNEASAASQGADRSRMLAHYMKGGEVGGLPEAIGAAGIQRELLPPVAEPFTLGVGDQRFDAKGNVVASGMPKPAEDERTDDIKEYEMAQEAGYKGSLQDWILEQKRAGAASTNIRLPPQQNAEAEAVGKWSGEQYGAIQTAGMEANSKISKYRRMGQLLEGVNTGKLAPTMAQIAAVGESFGIKIDDKLGEKQALEALSSEVALTLRNPSGGAGMPGALSDKDREFLMGMTPGLGKTPQGNHLIIETATKLADRDRQVAKLARDYRKKHGELNEGFYDELAAYSDANPLFGGMTMLGSPEAPPSNRPPLDSFGGK